ncbi:NifB/NifX family molybdenum-iron cluster-binding protein [Thiocapsa roseopersicina]|uniref:Predicted Fe-Mo cluster-binding protein, NifX family n=1 Tax=Thiocapsa roseopersicina TaxID=1058 RepID=A0A1H2S3G6_THIRO|nr:NifB/NifX family molybdenum-iron cluster-binding protein [Thiocapsa roseopersicina]SDW26252.1 Predicted Fe-Mo cluster-binding protein, NifX family [Thiocapsa roseopersicina]
MTNRSVFAVLNTGKSMRIAVTSQNFRTITGHAGKSRRFIVYEANADGNPTEVDRLDLPMELSLHDYHGDDHPLFELKLNGIVTQGAGTGFLQRMARHGIQVYTTSATDPLQAVSAILAGQPLPAAAPHTHDHGAGEGAHHHD